MASKKKRAAMNKTTVYWIKEIVGSVFLAGLAYIWLVIAFIMSQ